MLIKHFPQEKNNVLFATKIDHATAWWRTNSGSPSGTDGDTGAEIAEIWIVAFDICHLNYNSRRTPGMAELRLAPRLQNDLFFSTEFCASDSVFSNDSASDSENVLLTNPHVISNRNSQCFHVLNLNLVFSDRLHYPHIVASTLSNRPRLFFLVFSANDAI